MTSKKKKAAVKCKTKERKIFLRPDAEETKLIETVMKETDQKTASKALLTAAKEYLYYKQKYGEINKALINANNVASTFKHRVDNFVEAFEGLKNFKFSLNKNFNEDED